MTYPKLTTAATGGDSATAGDAANIEELHFDILIQVLRHLDGASLISVNSSTSFLRSISSHPDLWCHLCLSTWPSLHHPRILPLLNSSPRHFFSDAFTFPTSFSPAGDAADLPDNLISAVDLYHRGIPVFSCTIETDTSTPWFRASPFLINTSIAIADVSLEDLTLSWIVIDPTKGRAVNLSSQSAVGMRRRQWSSGETVARFMIVRDVWAVGATVTQRKGSGDVMEIGLIVEDMDGVCVNGMEGLRVVKAAMEAKRKRKGKGEEEAKEMYLEYLKMKRNREVRRNKRERLGDMSFAVVAAVVFLALVSLFIFQ